MTNYDRIMDTPLKKLWRNLSPECIADLIANSELDCLDCPLVDICDLGENETCNEFILNWLRKRYIAN